MLIIARKRREAFFISDSIKIVVIDFNTAQQMAVLSVIAPDTQESFLVKHGVKQEQSRKTGGIPEVILNSVQGLLIGGALVQFASLNAVRSGAVKIGVEAPKDIRVWREELEASPS